MYRTSLDLGFIYNKLSLIHSDSNSWKSNGILIHSDGILIHFGCDYGSNSL